MPATEYFRLVANTPQLAAAIRTQAMFTMFHHDDIKSADARAAQLQVRLKSYLPAVSMKFWMMQILKKTRLTA